MHLRSVFSTALVAVTFPVATHAQVAQLTVGVGVAQIDGSGIHTASVVHVAVEREFFKPWTRLQARVSVSRPDEDFIGTRTYVIPEVVLQVQPSKNKVQPFINLGVGAARTSQRLGKAFTDLSLSAGAGVRARIYGNLGSHVEVRARGIGSSFSRSMTEITTGLSWQF